LHSIASYVLPSHESGAGSVGRSQGPTGSDS
jgi:hypothetical protein